MSQALSRKYRPQNFKQVVDQNHIKITLQNEILAGQIAHAYIFTGPRGIGKTSLARIMAKSLNCTNRKEKEFEPCNECNSCLSTTAGKNLDLIEIDAATNTQVDKVRENIVENVRFQPHGSKYKVFIIDEVHMLSTAAFNALLKTLEEPPEYVVFILCTTEIYKLPETIISRCQRFDFKKVSAEQIAGKLKKMVSWEKLNIDDKVLENIAFRSGGFIRDAESLLGQVVTLITDDKKKITLEDIDPILPHSELNAISELVVAIIKHNAKTGIEIINKLVSDGVDLERFNLDLIDYLRKIILVKTGLKDKDYSLMGLPEKIEQKIITQAEEISISKLTQALEKFMSQQNAIKEAEISQLPLELVVIELCNTDETLISPDFPDKKIEKNIPSSISKKVKKEEKKIEVNVKTNKEPARRSDKVSLESVGEIRRIWSEFLKQIQKVNHSLPLILKSAYPLNLNNNQLELGFEYEIHAQRMKEESCLKSAEEILEKILGNKIIIKPIILTAEQVKNFKLAEQNNSKNTDTSQVDEILKSFGGKVVE